MVADAVWQKGLECRVDMTQSPARADIKYACRVAGLGYTGECALPPVLCSENRACKTSAKPSVM